MYTTTFLVTILASHVISHASVLQLRTSVRNSVNVVLTVSCIRKSTLLVSVFSKPCVLSPKILSLSHEVVTSLLSIVILCLVAVPSWLKLVSEERFCIQGVKVTERWRTGCTKFLYTCNEFALVLRFQKVTCNMQVGNSHLCKR